MSCKIRIQWPGEGGGLAAVRERGRGGEGQPVSFFGRTGTRNCFPNVYSFRPAIYLCNERSSLMRPTSGITASLVICILAGLPPPTPPFCGSFLARGWELSKQRRRRESLPSCRVFVWFRRKREGGRDPRKKIEGIFWKRGWMRVVVNFARKPNNVLFFF